MDRFIIHGRYQLRGSIRISGSKNSLLPILAATVLTEDPCIIRGYSNLSDVGVMLEILRMSGAQAEVCSEPNKDTFLAIDPHLVEAHEIREDLTRQMRSSIFMIGPLVARLGKAKVSYPGGCAIGPRPIDLHLRGLKALGVQIQERYGFIYANAPKLIGAEIHLDFPSVGATENIMMAAVKAEGCTIIRNAAKEPEIIDLQNFMNKMGAKVRGAGTDVVRIEGVQRLHGADHTVIPDRIETGTFMVAAAITGGEVILENCIPQHVEAMTAKLRETGCIIKEYKDKMRIKVPQRVKATDFKTLPYPGFPTDMQPQVMALMSIADGTSVIIETIFENRFKQAEELRRMGAVIKTDGRTAIIKGIPMLSGAIVEATDLRCAASLVLAGLAAEGTTVVEGIHHLDRGYEEFDEKVLALGGKLERRPFSKG